jgi:hypothetical protein
MSENNTTPSLVLSAPSSAVPVVAPTMGAERSHKMKKSQEHHHKYSTMIATLNGLGLASQPPRK